MKFLRLYFMRLVAFLILAFLPWNSFLQKEITCYFKVDNITLKYKSIQDSTTIAQFTDRAFTELRLNGYTGLTIRDSLHEKNEYTFFLSYTRRYEKIILRDQYQTNQKKEEFVSSKNYQDALKNLNKKLIELEDNGYPFAQITIVRQQEEDTKITLDYKLDSGQFFIIDKITLKSKDKFHEATLLNIIDMQVGEPYSESKIQAIDDLLKASVLYKLIRPVEVLFREGKAEVFVFLEKLNSSDGDGYVGFQQDKTTAKLALNGYLNLSLVNAFNRAEIISVNWKNNPDKTQNLKLQFEYPYILKTPVAIGARLNLQKQDSSFVRADTYFDVSYLQPHYKFGIYYQIENSTTILNNVPSDLRDYTKNTVGLSLRFTPKMPDAAKFYHPVFSASGGFFNYRGDSIDVNSNTGSDAKYTLRYAHVIDLLRYFHLNNAIQFEGLSAANTLSRNELIFFGGLRSMRGFYELELTGNDVVIINNEFEFAPVEVLSFKILYDYGSFQNQGWNYVQAVGFGFGFLAGNIKLEIVLANGWQNDNAPNLSNTKIHLGFKSTF